MKAITAVMLWGVCLVVFFIGLRLQSNDFEKNYIGVEDELILR